MTEVKWARKQANLYINLVHRNSKANAEAYFIIFHRMSDGDVIIVNSHTVLQ